MLFDKLGTYLYLYPMGKKNETYVIPDSTTGIHDFAFDNIDFPKAIIIPKSINNAIVNEFSKAFSGCSLLEIVTIPKEITEIEYGVFMDCS